MLAEDEWNEHGHPIRDFISVDDRDYDWMEQSP